MMSVKVLVLLKENASGAQEYTWVQREFDSLCDGDIFRATVRAHPNGGLMEHLDVTKDGDPKTYVCLSCPCVTLSADGKMEHTIEFEEVSL